MPISFLKRDRQVLTAPVFSKTIFPFVIDRSIASGGDYKILGRIERPVDPNSKLDMTLVFQTQVYEYSNLKIKYEAILYGSDIEQNINNEDILISDDVSNSYNILFSNTGNNTKVLITAFAVSETPVLSWQANKIDLVYLEKKEA